MKLIDQARKLANVYIANQLMDRGIGLPEGVDFDEYRELLAREAIRVYVANNKQTPIELCLPICRDNLNRSIEIGNTTA